VGTGPSPQRECNMWDALGLLALSMTPLAVGDGPASGDTRRMMDVRTWVDRQRASHARENENEARRFAELSPEARAELLVTLCASAFKVLDALPLEERERALEWRDPVPAHSVAAMARLRKSYRGNPGGR